MKKLLTILMLLVSTSVFAQTVNRTLGWDPSPEPERVLEYHVFRDGVYVGSTTAPALTFPFTIAPGQTSTFFVRSYGWLKDENGNLLTTAGEGPDSIAFTYQEPNVVPPPPELCDAITGYGNGIDDNKNGTVDEGCAVPVVSPNSATCHVSAGCWLVDAGLNVWMLRQDWAILKNYAHWNGGYSDWLLWFNQNMYAYRSDLNRWWLDTGTTWADFPYDPRFPPTPQETCAPDGYGNGVDEDGDGFVDEICKIPPTADEIAPTVSLTVTRSGAGRNRFNYSISAAATDAVGVTQITLYVNDQLMHICTGNDTALSCGAVLTQANKGGYVFKAIAMDAAGNTRTSTRTYK